LRRFVLHVSALTLALTALFGGVAFGHTVTCYTALGYTITCQPKTHDHLGYHAPNWLNDYSFDAGVQITQLSTGSFTWNRLIVANGVNVNDVGYLGDAYVQQTGPYAQLTYSRLWFCYPVSSLSYSDLGINVINSSTQGYWLQYSTDGLNSCYNPNPYTDYTAVQAY